MSRTHDNKHLTLSQRVIIEKGLENHESFAAIAKKTGKDPSTISKEVRRHISHFTKKDGKRDIPCVNRKDCHIHLLCNDDSCARLCKFCWKPNFYCTSVCPDYQAAVCPKLDKPPYVCNGCSKKGGCLMKRSYYSAKYAQDLYDELLVSSREGINQSPVDIAMLDKLISPLLKKGQSLAHIYAHHASEIPCCRKTLYNYIDKSFFFSQKYRYATPSSLQSEKATN